MREVNLTGLGYHLDTTDESMKRFKEDLRFNLVKRLKWVTID